MVGSGPCVGLLVVAASFGRLEAVIRSGPRVVLLVVETASGSHAQSSYTGPNKGVPKRKCLIAG